MAKKLRILLKLIMRFIIILIIANLLHKTKILGDKHFFISTNVLNKKTS